MSNFPPTKIYSCPRIFKGVSLKNWHTLSDSITGIKNYSRCFPCGITFNRYLQKKTSRNKKKQFKFGESIKLMGSIIDISKKSSPIFIVFLS